MPIHNLLPTNVFLFSIICLLMFITVLITRSLTISFMKKHWTQIQDEGYAKIIHEKKVLENKNQQLKTENNDLKVWLKTVKAVTDKIIL